MLNENTHSDSAMSGAIYAAVSDVMHSSKFIHNLAEELADILGGKYEPVKMNLEQLQQVLNDGVKSGAGNSAEVVFDRLEAKYTAMASGLAS
jgi:hypothetical protein